MYSLLAAPQNSCTPAARLTVPRCESGSEVRRRRNLHLQRAAKANDGSRIGITGRGIRLRNFVESADTAANWQQVGLPYNRTYRAPS